MLCFSPNYNQTYSPFIICLATATEVCVCVCLFYYSSSTASASNLVWIWSWRGRVVKPANELTVTISNAGSETTARLEKRRLHRRQVVGEGGEISSETAEEKWRYRWIGTCHLRTECQYTLHYNSKVIQLSHSYRNLFWEWNDDILWHLKLWWQWNTRTRCNMGRNHVIYCDT